MQITTTETPSNSFGRRIVDHNLPNDLSDDTHHRRELIRLHFCLLLLKFRRMRDPNLHTRSGDEDSYLNA